MSVAFSYKYPLKEAEVDSLTKNFKSCLSESLICVTLTTYAHSHTLLQIHKICYPTSLSYNMLKIIMANSQNKLKEVEYRVRLNWLLKPMCMIQFFTLYRKIKTIFVYRNGSRQFVEMDSR